mgnify:CR=1 FL=1
MGVVHARQKLYELEPLEPKLQSVEKYFQQLSIIVPNVKTRQYRTVHTLLQLVQQLSSYIYRDHV